MATSIIETVLHFRWIILASAFVAWIVGVAVYRRFFHPLAKVPGPAIAAITMLYQTCYRGKYFEEIGRMHEKYGPVVRINPDEVHLSDPENYDKIYYIGSKYPKGTNFYRATCVSLSTFGCESNETHRIRRGAMNPMFSRKMVLELEAVVQDKANTLCTRLQSAIDKNEPCDMHHGLRAVSIDVISDFAFNKSYDLLKSEDLGYRFFELTGGVGASFWVFQQIPPLRDLALSIPPWIASRLDETLGKVLELQAECVRQVESVKARMAAGKYSDRQTIFSTLLSPEDKPDGYVVPPTEHLKEEAYSVIMAAADTTGNAMTIALFHALRNPEVYEAVSKELHDTFPNADNTTELSFMELEKLPYLTAVIKEGLRLSFGVPGRLPRHVPEPGATFNGYYIPPGYVVGMSSWMQHRNPNIFPDPMKFDPNRWMDLKTFHDLDHYLVSFGKGTRACVGMPLAYCELYVTLGTLFRRFPFPGLRVYKTEPKDLEMIDYFSSYHIRGRNWLKVVKADGEKSG